MLKLPLEAIRQAVNAGEFGRAQLLWRECSGALAAELTRGHLTTARQGEVRELLSEVRELTEWSRMVVLCARVRLQNRLNSLHVAREYETPTPARRQRIVSASF
jgi:hypothetical protein